MPPSSLPVIDAANVSATKDLTEERITAQQRGSVMAEDPFQKARLGDASSMGVLWVVSDFADGIPAWGVAPSARDRTLREYVTSGAESLTTSSIGTIIARNSGFAWKLTGPESLTGLYHEILHTANQGAGWLDLVAKVSFDLYTQDKGAFIEVIRAGSTDTSPVVGLQHLDALQCWATGDPLAPVLYQDVKLEWHRLKWFQVIHLLEMPATFERLPGLQVCAMSRILRASQAFRNVATYYEEKTGGRHTKAIHVINGLSQKQIDDALAQHQNRADAQLLRQYIQPVVLSNVDPEYAPQVATLELASLPDGFDAEQMMKQFITIVALGTFEDYQTFAPLPGGGLGTSNQSEILHRKSKGKGPGLFMNLLAYAINYRVLPRGVTFEWDEQDYESDQTLETVRQTRATTLTALVTGGILDKRTALARLLAGGDLTQEEYDQAIAAIDDAEARAAELAQRLAANPPAPGQPGQQQALPPGRGPASTQTTQDSGAGAKAGDDRAGPSRAGPDDVANDRLVLEAVIADDYASALTAFGKAVRAKLRIKPETDDTATGGTP